MSERMTDKRLAEIDDFRYHCDKIDVTVPDNSDELLQALKAERLKVAELEAELKESYNGIEAYKSDVNQRLNKKVAELEGCLKEAVDLMEDVITGDYRPDSFTTQPWRTALLEKENE